MDGLTESFKKFESEHLFSDENVVLKLVGSLGRKGLTGYDFSRFYSCLYLTNRRLALETHKLPAVAKLAMKAMVLAFTSVNGSGYTLKPLANQSIDFNPNEDNVLSIDFQKVSGIEVRDRLALVLPADIAVLHFVDGNELPVTFGAKSLIYSNAAVEATSLSNSFNQLRLLT